MFRVIICEEEKDRALALHGLLSRVANDLAARDKVELLLMRPEKLLEYNVDERYTCLFILDIIYKNVSGIDIAMRLREQYKNIFILFVTAHTDLVFNAINQNVMPSGFLVRPPVESEFKRVFLSIYDYYKNDRKMAAEMLTVASGANVYRFMHSEIYYIEALNKKINIYTNSKRVTCYSSLNYLQEVLSESFVRCHKSYLVNKEKVKHVYMAEMYIEMRDGSRVPFSRTFRTAVKKMFGEVI